MRQRFLTPEDIPQLLVTSERLLCLPRELRDVYSKTLKEAGLFEMARSLPVGETIGGESKEDADKHLANRFSGSCSRVALAMLDPWCDLGDSSDTFIRAFSGGEVRILDIPCGCGAASATLLTTIAELRRLQIIPREPLDVFLTGGDFSHPAREYACQILDGLKPELRCQGIFLTVSILPWDLTDDISNTSLLNEWLKNQVCDKTFLLISGFSGVLSNEGKIKKAKGQLGEAIRWAGTRKATITWIESQTAKARKMWGSDTLRGVLEKLNFLSYGRKRPSDNLESESECAHPLFDDCVYTTRLILNQWRVPLNESKAGNFGQTGSK